MQKLPWLISILACFLLLITGCNEPQPKTDDAMKTAEAYKTTEYKVDFTEDLLSAESIQKRNEAIKPFLTESFYEKQVNNRITILPLRVAADTQLSIKPDDLQTRIKAQDENNVTIEYTVNLLLTNSEGRESNRVPLEGELMMTFVNERWLVQYDDFNVQVFMKLISEK
ncbi:hypothetical protein U9M73_14340 [Paenibacillus phoenicis]|jgi:hypothetical protein|uniref:DUF4878 domain-containing protein n=4 Tax=Paenibacillus TaxID=44249 RepID=R9LTB8_9BACL|nr:MULTISPECIES: hypothetical protein [Paenibacillus]EOS58967.1 hypothetical protein C812_00136 [Paenibacillus barengoltzii G22]MEA3571148.1 hypothetical protein [Paenibacillus phoenicis]MEC2345857.1 hypothetical protein [Paenibacillus barengoltzii]SMF11424.1 hypothetical protein SAMN02744102_01475 [Paenibacillus barengoltzii]SMF66739.1 hypothetical protein SAMN02744124_04278 [Paenibacillus barengoltzii J12]